MTHATHTGSRWSDGGGNRGKMVSREGRQRRIRADVHRDEVGEKGEWDEFAP